MPRLLRLLACLFLALSVIGLAAPSAHADEESIRHLGVQFDIRPDGSVDVRYELEWHFAEEGRRGIEFNIVTRESWDQDARQDAVYEVSNLQVSSPSGAPAEFTQTPRGRGSDEELALRIGDPNTPLDTQDATYVISYRLTGAMRTFDGLPQFYWDVTSYDYPPIERFTIEVSAPEGVDQVRCLEGSTECQAEIRDGVGVYTGDDTNAALTVVAGLPADSVRNAEPNLEQRRIYRPTVEELTSDVELTADGRTNVTQELGIRFPGDEPEEDVELSLPTRLPWSVEHDQVFSYENVAVTDARGRPVRIEWTPSRSERSEQVAKVTFEVPNAQAVTEQTFTLSYTVDGAVAEQGDGYEMRIPLMPGHGDAGLAGQLTVTTPADISNVGCYQMTFRDGVRDCVLNPNVSGNQLTMDYALAPGLFPTMLGIELPNGALASAPPALQDSKDLAFKQYGRAGMVTAGAAVLLLGGGGVLLGRKSIGRDQRYANVPPGVLDPDGPTRAVSRGDQAPVQFSPPDIPLEAAGLVLDREFKPNHLAALLVDLAVHDAVQLKSRPLTVARANLDQKLSPLGRTLARQATMQPTELPTAVARSMRKSVTKAQQRVLVDQDWFQSNAAAGQETRRLLTIVTALGLPLFAVFQLPEWISPSTPEAWGEFNVPARFGVMLGAGMGFIGAMSGEPKPRLAATGTAMRDQIEGFRTYLATAEAEQLDFEADQDIFRRYLPWAVLFGLTERWTRVCQELADAGRIEPLDTAFIGGAYNAGELSRSLSSFSSSLGSKSAPPSSSGSGSSGGSGGSSGFSSSSSGGGGGGGTSAGSW